eukprot:4251253-Prymnesium_polylepis.1
MAEHQLTTAARLAVRAIVAISRSCDGAMPPGKYVARQPVGSVSIEGSISSDISSTFGSGVNHGALLASCSGARAVG